MNKKISNLLNRINEPDVRLTLEAEFSKLNTHKKFGLVFENHRPEVLTLLGNSPRRGDYVAIRGEPLGKTWKVIEVKGTNARITGDEYNDDSARDSDTIVSVNQLLVVKRFGDPIYPALKFVDAVSNDKEKLNNPSHALIEADNYHALQLLRYTYKNSVDCIYIDPPYNTGARDWKYNNDYVDASDNWRHSKWLSFMQKRLLLAKDLLKPKTGVIVVTIDEHEVHHLACLLAEIFPSARRQMVTIVNNGAGVSQGGLYRVEEYAFFCFLGAAKPSPGPDDMLSEFGAEPLTPYWFSLTRFGGIASAPSKRDNLVYPIGIDPDTLRIVGTGPSLRDRVNAGEVPFASDDWLPNKNETFNGYPVVWPFRGTGKLARWQVGADTLMDLQEQGFVRVRPHKKGPGGNGFTVSYVKSGNRAKVLKGEIPVLGREPSGSLKLGQSARNVIPKTVWRRARHDAGKWGSRILRETLGEVSFDYAKSPYAILDCLAACVGSNKDALILDFFAGSGTTLLATLLLNERDAGRRRCVLVTNNEVSQEIALDLSNRGLKPGDSEWEERGICRSVTWPRARNTIHGARQDGTKLEGEYTEAKLAEREIERTVTQLSFIDGATLTQAMRKDLLKLIAGMSPNDLTHEHFCFSKDGSTAVLFDALHAEEFLAALEDNAQVDKIFITTRDKSAFKEIREMVIAELGPKLTSVQETIPMSRGFPANVSYFKLDFLDPGVVSAGQAFEAILPILWMQAGCAGVCPTPPAASAKWLFADQSNFCVLIQERHFTSFIDQLAKRIDVTGPKVVFIVTDEDDSFLTWRKQVLALPWAKLQAGLPTIVQLYRNYLDNFRLQVSTTSRGN